MWWWLLLCIGEVLLLMMCCAGHEGGSLCWLAWRCDGGRLYAWLGEPYFAEKFWGLLWNVVS